MVKYKLDNWNELGRESGWNPEKNPVIVETAGFVPLEVKIKRLEENGIRAQMVTDMSLTSAEMRQIYLNPDFEISQYDDIEEVQAKLEARQLFMQQVLKERENSTQVVEKPVSETVVEPAPQGKPDSSTGSAQ